MTTWAKCSSCVMIIRAIEATTVVGICHLCFQVSISPSSDESDPADCFGGGDVSLPSFNIFK